ncbi:hypothetical protein, conserved [Eimeria necatrix]|uniref:Transmembrane protein n=1 Tax=Eimeria necatrix TaxID=51315 RepID=U6N2C5_9EIME|nr:hypothetical protein, conserved [Eimeria necatrix]CDJ68919.1 hypothetical protein, conserved [Eimeria necatrix]
MSRASDPPASFRSPPTRHNFGGISFLQHTQHGGTLHSSSGVSRSRPRLTVVAFHKARVVLLSVLAAVAITLGCFRALYGWAGNRPAPRQLAASFPRTNDDPELSAILDMCLDMEEERGSSTQVGMVPPLQGHIPSPGIPPASRPHQPPLQKWDDEPARWLINTVEVAESGLAVERLQYSLTISISEPSEGGYSTAGAHTQSHVPSWAGSSASSDDVALKSSVDIAKGAHAGGDTALDSSSRVLYEAHSTTGAHTQSDVPSWAGSWASSVDIALKSSVDIAKGAHAGGDTALDSSSRVFYEAHSKVEEHPLSEATQRGSSSAHQAFGDTASSRKRRFDESDLSDPQSPVAHQEGVEEKKAKENAPTRHEEAPEVMNKSSGFGGPLHGISPGELLQSVVLGSYEGRQVSSNRRSSEVSDSGSEESEELFAKHPFYKLPKLAPDLETNIFCEKAAFSRSNLSGHTSLLLMGIRSILKAEWVSEAKAKKLACDTERVVCNLFYLQREPVSHYIASRAVITLGQRFLLLDALVSALSVLSPVVNASAWWSKLVTVIPSEVPFNPSHTTFERTRQYEALSNRLIVAIESLKNGTRLGPRETVELKRDLLCRKDSPPWFKKRRWGYWREDDEMELKSSKESSCGKPAPTQVSDSSWSQ